MICGPVARLFAIWFGVLLALPALAQTDEQQTRDKLQQLQRDIAQINQQIDSAKTRRSSLRKQVKAAEVTLGKLQRDITEKRAAINTAQAELTTLQQQRGELQQARAEQQTRITEEMRAAWEMGNQGQLKVLLNQESPHTVARMLAYYRYFFSARNELIGDYRQTLQQLAEVETGIETTTTQLRQETALLEERQSQVEGAQRNRQQAVADLNASIASDAERLEQMQRDRAKLEQLLQAIEEAVIDLELPASTQPFAAAKGKMPWPVAGKASNRYGRKRNAGNMRWQGLQIPAKTGTTVKAIHHGRVVYADWFRGSGLLLIVDHGDGYMSLYAHNQSLLKEVGEWVSAGTPLGTVGTSGGLTAPALYFEIRKDGKPTNPASWCK